MLCCALSCSPCFVQDIPSFIEAAEAERSRRLEVQARMKEASGADKGLVLYILVGGIKRQGNLLP